MGKTTSGKDKQREKLLVAAFDDAPALNRRRRSVNVFNVVVDGFVPLFSRLLSNS